MVNPEHKRNYFAISILAGVLNEEVYIRRKSDDTLYKISITDSPDCSNPLCVGCYKVRLLDETGLILPGSHIDIDSLADFDPLPESDIARAFAEYQNRLIKEAVPKIQEYVDDRLTSDYVPKVGDVVKAYDSLGPDLPSHRVAVVIAELNDVQAKSIAQIDQVWTRFDMVLLVNIDGHWKMGTHNSRQFVKVGDCADYGISPEKLSELAEAYHPLDGRFGRFRPGSGRLAGLE